MTLDLLAVVLSLALGPLYVFVTDAGMMSKALVGVLLTLALLAWWTVPAWSLAAVLIQCAVCIYIVLYIQLQR